MWGILVIGTAYVGISSTHTGKSARTACLFSARSSFKEAPVVTDGATLRDGRFLVAFYMEVDLESALVADSTLIDYLINTYVPGRLDLRAGSIEQLAIAVNRLDAWHGSPVRLDDLSTHLIRRFLRDYRQQVSASTVNGKRRAILAIWRFAHEEGDVPELPGKIRLCKEYPELPEAWTVNEVERIIAVARQQPGEIDGLPASRWWPALFFAIYDSGSRIGAILDVAPKSLSLPERSLVLLGSTTKSGRPQYCRLSDQTVAAVAAIYDPHRSRVWPWPHQRKTLCRRVKRLFAAAGVSYGRDNGGLFQKLRKTSATLVAANGGNPQLHLGHADARVTYRHYVDPRHAAGGQLEYLPRLDTPLIEHTPSGAWLLD